MSGLADRNQFNAWRWCRIVCLSILVTVCTLFLFGWYIGAMDAPKSALNTDELPFYTQQNLQPRWDRWASWQQIAHFSLNDQYGHAIDETVFLSGPSFVGFFYGGCTSLCPVSLEVLRELQGQIAKVPGASQPRFLMMTVTPEIDDVRSLSEYSRRLNLPGDWHMLTGMRAEVKRLANSLLTDMEARTSNGEPLHGQRAFLVDKKGRIRGIYAANSLLEMHRMQADYERLMPLGY
ncbi:MAG: SCO family protein [Burkholderiales bacterium]|nr:SCO family protein [Burkholderiales bacterium]